MSRLGKLPVALPDKVTATITEQKITIKGPKAELVTINSSDVVVELKDNKVWVQPANDSKRARAMWGTVRANVNNLVKGVTEGFTERLEITGVGYRAAVAKDVLTLSLGFSHEVKYIVPAGVTVTVDKQTALVITGADKQKVGQVVAEIRSLRPPEPYKGKGIRKAGEKIRRKEGKKK